MAGHDHPIFTRVYGLIAETGEHIGAAEARAESLAAAHGRLLIVGLGPGFDLQHVPASVSEVVAVEPSTSMRDSADERMAELRRLGTPVRLVGAVGESLPFADDSFDSALFAFVLCSVTDVPAVLDETRRVLRSGASVGVLEHVRGFEGSWMRRAQRVLAPVWPRFSGGCHADRDTRRALSEAGFDTTSLRDTVLAPVPPVAPTLVGTMVR